MASLSLDDYRKMEKDVQSLQSEHDRSQGAFNQMVQQLRDDFGVATIEEARELLDVLEKESREASVEFQKKRDAFVKKYGGKIGV